MSDCWALGLRCPVGLTPRVFGPELVVGFLKDFAAIPMGDLAPAEACGKVRELRGELEAKQHPFVKRILAQAND